MSDNWPGTPVGTDQWPGKPVEAAAPQEKPQRGVLDQLTGETGPRYQTFPERIVKGVGTAIQQFMEAGTAGPPGSREVTEAAIRPAAEIAGTFSPVGPEARMATVARKVAPQAPTQEALRDVISQQYGELDKLGVQIPQEEVTNLAKQAREDLMHGKDGGHRPLNQPGTFGLLDELETTPGRFTDIDSVRKALGKVRMDVARNKSDAEAAGVVIRKIDDFLSSQADETGNLAGSARGNVSALKKSEQITAGRESAELSAATTGSGANLANRFRQNIKQIIDPKYPHRKIGFRPEEVELMDEIARGGGRYSAENIARLVSKLGPTHPLTGWGAALGSVFAGDAGIGLTTLAVGHFAQWLSEKLPFRKINRLDEMIRQRSPLGQSQSETTVSRPLVGTGQELLMRSGIPTIIDQLGQPPSKGAPAHESRSERQTGRVMAEVPPLILDVLSSWAEGKTSNSGARSAMPPGWSVNSRLTVKGKGVEILGPDGKIHFVPNSDF